MLCIECGTKTKVVETVTTEEYTFRKRVCPTCEKRMDTYEDLVTVALDSKFRLAFNAKTMKR